MFLALCSHLYRVRPLGASVRVSWVLCAVRWRSASRWSLVQRSSTECNASVCRREASTMKAPWPTGGCRATKKVKWKTCTCLSPDGPSSGYVQTFKQEDKICTHHMYILYVRAHNFKLFLILYELLLLVAYLQSSPPMIRSWRMTWAGHVARLGDRRGAYRVSVRKPERKRPLGRPRRAW